MKKFLVFLFFLLVLGGTGFFFGWAQLKVPPGSYGVIRSKTHGLDPTIIRDGEIRWIWYKLLPTNVKISVYTINTVKHQIRNTGSLRSGAVYASLAGIDADFSWNINGEISFNIRPERLPELCGKENINDDADLRKAEEILAERIGGMTLQRVVGYIENNDEKKIESLAIGASIPELESEISASFPEIENLSCTIRVLNYPDFALYQSIKALYQEYLARQSAVLKPEIVRDAENRIEGRIRLDELAQYGELLTKYPILLQYLALERGISPSAEH